MRIVTLLSVFFLFLLGCTPKMEEKVMAPPASVPVQTNPKDSFPHTWVGKWTGELEIWKGSGKVQAIPMTMEIEPVGNTGEFHWKTTFGDKTETTKPYLLKTTDETNGLYVIDEQNSIVIESYLFDNKLVSWYIVAENLILASFEKRGELVVFEILAGSEKPVSTTGGQKIDEEDIPEVKTLPFSVMQRAILSRENTKKP